jgi:hypothetical protein
MCSQERERAAHAGGAGRAQPRGAGGLWPARAHRRRPPSGEEGGGGGDLVGRMCVCVGGGVGGVFEGGDGFCAWGGCRGPGLGTGGPMPATGTACGGGYRGRGRCTLGWHWRGVRTCASTTTAACRRGGGIFSVGGGAVAPGRGQAAQASVAGGFFLPQEGLQGDLGDLQ